MPPGSEAAELANRQSFLKELCLLLGVPEPEPTQAGNGTFVAANFSSEATSSG
ncbi:MAG: hypothetical protein ACK5A3_16170 [Planctomyces sp.]